MIVVRLRQPSKAKLLILVTLVGIVMLVRLLQFMKASFPMLVTGFPSMASGITSAPEAAVLQSVMVTVSPEAS